MTPPAPRLILVDREFLLATLRRLVGTDSVNPSLIPDAHGEAAVARVVAEAMDGIGLEVEIVEPVPGRPSVVGILRGTGGGRSLAWNGHVDTVGVEGMHDPFGARVEGNFLHGRGSYDMKGSIAAMLAGAKALVDAGARPKGDLHLHAVADEEVASLGTAAVIDRFPTDGAIVTEPTHLALALAHKGFVWIEVETAGRAAHGSRFDLGVDANLRMGRVLARLADLEAELRGRPAHPLVGPPSLHAATLAGGTGWSTYADRAVLGIERRTAPGESAESALAEIAALLDVLRAEDPSFEATVKPVFARESFEGDPAGPLAAAISAAARAATGRDPEVRGEAYWMDAALYGAAGIETAAIGPSGAGAHELEEWVDLDSCAAVAEILAGAALDYCGAEG